MAPPPTPSDGIYLVEDLKTGRTFSVAPPQRRQHGAHASIVLVGAPGAGKRSLGFIAATYLRRPLYTENRFFETVTGLTKTTFLDLHGREALAERNLQVLQQLLDHHPFDCVIDCGASSLIGGARNLLATYTSSRPVIHIIRSPDDILRHWSLPVTDSHRVSSADTSHRACTNFEFFNLFDATTAAGNKLQSPGPKSPRSSLILQAVKLEFCSFVDAVLGRRPDISVDPLYSSNHQILCKPRSFLATWPLSQLLSGTRESSDNIDGTDAVELRVDKWYDGVESDISKFIAGIRRHHKASIIYSIDDDILHHNLETYMLALAHGVRLGTDYVVLNAASPLRVQRWLLHSRGYSSTIAHFSVNESGRYGRAWLHPDRLVQYSMAQDLGYNAVRMTTNAVDRDDNRELEYFRGEIEHRNHGRLPLIAYNKGSLGRQSQLRNAMLTPVVAETTVAKNTGRNTSELSIRTITEALFASFEYEPLKFSVFGASPMEFSRSPAMYLAAFQTYGLAHDMSYQSTASIQQVLQHSQAPNFGGAAISFPYKEAAFEACSGVSSHAAAIGSINCLLPLRRLPGDRPKHSLQLQAALGRNMSGDVVGFYGDNTDWVGFYHNLRREMSPRNAFFDTRETALVLGAGGSARAAIYALIIIGFQNIYIRNRTEARATQLAAHFNDWCRATDHTSTTIQILQPNQTLWPRGTLLPTVVIACVPTERDFHLPSGWLDSSTGGVAMEISYNNEKSTLRALVGEKQASTGRPWTLVDGLDILFESAVIQFELLTSYPAPRDQMAQFLRPRRPD